MATVSIEGYRLSPQQKAVWRHGWIGRPYHAQCAIDVKGLLQKDVLKDALKRLIEHHEILRTVYARLPGMDLPVQVIAERQELCYREADISGSPVGQQATQVEAALRSDGGQDFDYERGPIVRFQLLTLAADEHVLICTAPSASLDGRSLGNLAGEIGRCYQACLEHKELPDDIVQYADYSEWLNERLQETAGKAAGSQVLNRLKQSALTLPLESKARADAPPLVDWFHSIVDPGLAARIEAVALREGSSTASFLLACWQVLLWRMTGQSDIALTYYCDGRKHKRLKHALGLFGRSLPLVAEIHADFRVAEVLEMADRATRALENDQDNLSFEDVASLNHEIDHSSSIGYEYEEWPSPSATAEVAFALRRQAICRAPAKLVLRLLAAQPDLCLQWQFDRRRLSPYAVKLIAERFICLLAAAAAAPDRRLLELQSLPAEQRRRLVKQAHGTRRSPAPPDSLDQLLQRQVAATPDALAVVCGEQHLSFAGLQRRAQQLAGGLRRLGVGAEVSVGICLPRCLAQVVAIFGVLKAGGAYLPLDPANPAARLRVMVQASGVAVILSQVAWGDRLRASGAAVLCLDEADGGETLGEADGGEAEGGAVGVCGANLAYEIYTSGTSGRPKGVMIEQQSVVNLLAGLEEAIYGGAQRRVGVNAAIWFDASVKQVFQVVKGRTVIVLGDDERQDSEQLVKVLNEQMVEVLDSTPSQLRQWREAGLESCGSLRQVLVGGEAIEERLWEEMSGSQGVSYYNLYGPTECTVDATVSEVSGKEVRIGRAMSWAAVSSAGLSYAVASVAGSAPAASTPAALH